MTKYTLSPQVYGFIEWTGSNLTECQEICDSYVTLTQDGDTMQSNQGGYAYPGNFVRSDGRIGFPDLSGYQEVTAGSAYAYDITTTP